MKIFILLMTLFGMKSHAFEVPVIDVVNWSENYAIAQNTVASLKNQTTQIKNALESLQLLTKNSKSLKDLEWRNLQELILEMNDIATQGQAIAYNMRQVGEKFDKAFPEILNPKTQAVRDTLKSNMLVLHKSAEDFTKQQRSLDALKRHSQQAEGHMQAVQVASEIAAENINQLQELKRVIAAQSNAHMVFMSHQVTNEAQETQAVVKFLNDSNIQNYKPQVTFGKLKF